MKQPHDGSNVKNGDSGQVGRNDSKSERNPTAQPYDPGPPRKASSGGDLTGSRHLQQLLTQQQEGLQLKRFRFNKDLRCPSESF